MSDTNTASVKHDVITHPPMITDGELSPKIIREFEIRCNVYFMNIKGGVADDQKVRKLLGSFKNTLIQDWMSTESDRLIQLSFTDFMNEFRERWLPTNWEQSVLTQMLGTHLDPTKQTFETWASQILSHNVSLRKTKSHMTEEALRRQLEIMLDEELRTLACEANVAKIAGLRDWMTKVKELDNRRQIDLKRMAQFFDAASMRAAKRQNTGAHPNARASFSNLNNRSNTTRNTSTTASSSNPTLYPPRLTDEERRLLHDHEGCLKCREFYAGHRAKQCTVTLSGKDYKVRTIADALRAKARNGNRAPPIAAITEPDNGRTTPAPDLIAAVFPQNTTFVTDKSLSEGSDTSVSSVSAAPLKEKHFVWTCQLSNITDRLSLKVKALIDGGAHMVLVRPDIAARLALPKFPLTNPEQINVAMGTPNEIEKLTHYVVIKPSSLDSIFLSQPLHAVIAPGLCMPIILGLLFLTSNKIVCNYAERQCVATKHDPPYNLLAKNKDKVERVTANPDVLAALKDHIVSLSLEEELIAREMELRKRFSRIFEPPPHVDKLPTEPVARIQLKDQSHTIKSRNYPCPRKWKEVWHTLLQQHLDAGRIRPSSVPTGSGAFIIPKADPTVLPRWVNDYRQLNANTVTDSFPIPRINEILSDCAQGKVFATLDMTNSFFQTRMHPDDVSLTAVNTPWGLYEWVVMPMGIRNAPAIHQRRAALRPWIGRFCHVYMDDISVWSRTLDEHTENLTTLLQALLDNELYLNPKKTKLFCSKFASWDIASPQRVLKQMKVKRSASQTGPPQLAQSTYVLFLASSTTCLRSSQN